MVEEVRALQQKIKTDKSTAISCKFCGRMHERQKTNVLLLEKDAKSVEKKTTLQ